MSVEKKGEISSEGVRTPGTDKLSGLLDSGQSANFHQKDKEEKGLASYLTGVRGKGPTKKKN